MPQHRRDRWCRSGPMWSMTEPLGERLVEAVATRGAVADTDLADNHYRIVDGDRLLWCGRITTWQRRRRESLQGALRRDMRTFIRSSARSRSSMPGPACSAMRCTGCRRSASLSPGLLARERRSAATGSTPPPWRARSSRARSRTATTPGGCLRPIELVWAGGRNGPRGDAGLLLGDSGARALCDGALGRAQREEEIRARRKARGAARAASRRGQAHADGARRAGGAELPARSRR